MKPLATIGDLGWRAQLRAAGIDKRSPPSSGEPDRGYIEQPGERLVATKPSAFGRPPEREARVVLPPPPPPPPPANESEPITEEEREEAVPAKTKRERATYTDDFKRKAVRKVLERGDNFGDASRVAKELGVTQSSISLWMSKHGDAVRAEMDGKTLVSAPESGPVSRPSGASVDQASRELADKLGAYINAVIDARIEEALKERMKRLI